jgi:hypothetical protein
MGEKLNWPTLNKGMQYVFEITHDGMYCMSVYFNSETLTIL